MSTDWHLEEDNLDEIEDLIHQQCSLSEELGTKDLFCLGDIFDSRISQKQSVLSRFSKILDYIEEKGMVLYSIPGNHDKTDYGSKESFLTPFKGRKCFELFVVSGGVPYPEYGIMVEFLPFFKEDVWIKKFKEVLDYNEGIDVEKRILCTHIAITGSRNNDGSLVTSSLSSKLFKNYFKVFSGHYHDTQKIGSNFIHIPSIRQNDYGENTNKGFTVVYSDGSHEIINSKFKKFIKIDIDIDSQEDELVRLTKKYKNNDDNIRFEISGSENKLKSFKKENITSVGIDVKTKIKEIQDDVLFIEKEEIKKYNKSSIKGYFAEFCEEEGLSEEEGLIFLTKILLNENK